MAITLHGKVKCEGKTKNNYLKKLYLLYNSSSAKAEEIPNPFTSTNQTHAYIQTRNCFFHKKTLSTHLIYKHMQPKFKQNKSNSKHCDRI